MGAALAPYDIRRILRGNKDVTPADDFRLVDSWAEYAEARNGNENERELQYLCYEIEVIDPENGKVQRAFKALKFARVIRLPKEAKQSTSMMDMHTEILAACYEQGYNLVTIIANIIEPVPLGLLYLYGVQGVAATIEDAKDSCSRNFSGLIGMLQGTYRVLHLRNVVAQETEWLREKIYSMDYLTMIKGIPQASKQGEMGGAKGIGGTNVNPDAHGTLEQMIIGMVDYEYVIQILSSPVYASTLKAWSVRTQQDMTDWNSQLQGTKSLSFNLSIPMMYMANASQSQGWSQAYTDAESISYNTGESFSQGVSESIGQSISNSIGESFGRSFGTSVSDSVSYSQSVSNGTSTGTSYSISEGFSSSLGRSFSEGFSHTESTGTSDSLGTSIGESLSRGINQNMGSSLGESIGFNTGNSYTVGQGASTGLNQSSGWSEGFGASHSQNLGSNMGGSYAQSLGQNQGANHSQSLGQSVGGGYSFNQGSNVGGNQSYTEGTNQSISQGINQSTNQSINQGFNQSINQSINQSVNQSVNHGLSTNQSVSDSYSYGENQSSSSGGSLTNTSSENWGLNGSQGTTNTNSFGKTTTTSDSATVTNTTGDTITDSWNKNNSANFGVGVNQSANFGSNSGFNLQLPGLPVGFNSGSNEGGGVGASFNGGIGASAGTGGSVSQNNSNAISIGATNSEANSQTQSFGNTSSNGWNTGGGTSTAAGNTWSNSYGDSQTWGNSVSNGIGENWGTSQGTSQGSSQGMSQGTSQGMSQGTSQGTSQGASQGASQSNSYGNSWGASQGESWNDSWSNNRSDSYGTSYGVSQGESWSDTWSNSRGESWGTSQNAGITGSVGISQSDNMSANWGVSEGSSSGYNIGNSISDGWSEGFSSNTGMSRTHGTSTGESLGTSVSSGVTDTQGTSSSRSSGNTFNQSVSFSDGITQGRSVGQTSTDSVSQSYSNGTSQSATNGTSLSTGRTTGRGTSESISQSMGTSGQISTGSSGSMGLGPSIGYNKSYQWLDQTVKDILEILEFQNERIKQALRGFGAFYTYVYIACDNQDALSTAMGLARTTWHNNLALAQPIQALNLSEEEQRHLLYHFSAFSADVTRETIGGVSEYKYATVLLSSEYVAYTHLPRVSEGGIFAEAEDVPKFAVPSMLKGEIYMGSVLSAERYSFKNGYQTPYDFRISESELMHGFITGASRSGKTVAAMRFVAELSKVRRSKTGKRLRIVCMDPKRDWRTLARFVEPERFRFYSMVNPNFHPINLNPCKIPKGVVPQIWVDALIEIYCRAYGLLERGKQLMAETFYYLYKKAGVFDVPEDQPDWGETVSELSRQVTFTKAYERMLYNKQMLEDPTNPKGKAGNDTRDAYARLLERLSAFEREYSIERRIFGNSDGLGVDDLIGGDDVTVIESKGLESTFKNFIFGVITSGFFRYAIAHEDGYLAPDQYETVLVIEEANEVLTGNDAAGTGGGQQFGLTGQSEFEQILDQAAGYGLFIFAITQKIADMPKSIIANSGLVFAGKIKAEDDINVLTKTIGRDPRFDNRDVAKWFPRSPTGWFVCQSSRTTTFTDAEPVLCKIAMLNMSAPSNAEIEELLLRRETAALTSNGRSYA